MKLLFTFPLIPKHVYFHTFVSTIFGKFSKIFSVLAGENRPKFCVTICKLGQIFNNSHSSWLQCQSNSSEPTCVVGATQVQRSVVTFPHHLHSDLITCNAKFTFLNSRCTKFTNQKATGESTTIQGTCVLDKKCIASEPYCCTQHLRFVVCRLNWFYLPPVEPVHCRKPGLCLQLHCCHCLHQLCRSCGHWHWCQIWNFLQHLPRSRQWSSRFHFHQRELWRLLSLTCSWNILEQIKRYSFSISGTLPPWQTMATPCSGRSCKMFLFSKNFKQICSNKKYWSPHVATQNKYFKENKHLCLYRKCCFSLFTLLWKIIFSWSTCENKENYSCHHEHLTLVPCWREQCQRELGHQSQLWCRLSGQHGNQSHLFRK